MDWSNSILRYLKSKQPEKVNENNTSAVESILILMSVKVKEMGEMRVAEVGIDPLDVSSNCRNSFFSNEKCKR